MRLRRALRRGQALVLFALTMLLLTLMVCMTLSFGTKAKEKMELQTVADQAAYSNAVAVARTFNVISVTNRAMIAHMVALIGVQSSISFASAYYAYIFQLWLNYTLELNNQQSKCRKWWAYCGCPGVIGVFFGRWLPLLMELIRVRSALMGLDMAAAQQVRNNRTACTYLYAGQLEAYLNQLYYQSLDGQKLARKVVNQASGGRPEWSVPSGADSVAKRETGLIPLLDGAVNINNLIGSDRHVVLAGMSSRGHPWTANRDTTSWLPSGAPQLLTRAFRRVGLGNEVRLLTQGNGYYGPAVHTNTRYAATSTFAWADDHGAGSSRYRGPGCFPRTYPVIAAAYVRSSNSGPSVHMAGFAVPIFRFMPDMPPTPILLIFPVWMDPQHNTGGFCLLNCPSVWSSFVDYNYLKVVFPSDNWAQPKQPVVVQRNLSARSNAADPWNLGFRFRFTPPGEGFDLKNNNRILLRDGTNISRQTAMATGIAYYHRAGHWREPPNLVNPFWRAGLTHADIDDQARGPNGDIPDTLNGAGVGWAADAHTRLWNAGYRGMQ